MIEAARETVMMPPFEARESLAIRERSEADKRFIPLGLWVMVQI